MRQLYPEINPYKTYQVAVEGGLHHLYIEEVGNPQGYPILITHGGPGFGCDAQYRRFFNPQKYRMIIFDQRGCGRSQPAPCLEKNTLAYTLEDIEKIRHYLGIEKWAYFGGSWGSRIGIAYAQAYPRQVVSLILRGIYFADSDDIEWFYGANGAAQMSPDYYQYLQKLAPGQSGLDLVRAYYVLLTGKDEKLKQAAAKAYTAWTVRNCAVKPNTYLFDSWVSNAYTARCFALISTHTILYDNYTKKHHPLDSAGIKAIKNIPGVIAQGRYDMICRAYNAWRLHQAWPSSKLFLSDEGHASSEPDLLQALLNACEAVEQTF